MSAFGLARRLGIERGVGRQSTSNAISRAIPGVKRFMERHARQARETGYVETVFGRRLYLPDIRSGNNQDAAVRRARAINAPMQGTAADIIKRAMIAVDALAASAKTSPRALIMQVHDELVLEVREDAVDAVTAAHPATAWSAPLNSRCRSRSKSAPAPTGTRPTRSIGRVACGAFCETLHSFRPAKARLCGLRSLSVTRSGTSLAICYGRMWLEAHSVSRHDSTQPGDVSCECYCLP